MMGQRLYNDRKWPNPVVLKMTGATPALSPPAVVTRAATRPPGSGRATLEGELKDLGQADSVEVGFQYRRHKRTEELYSKAEGWTDTAFERRTAPGAFSTEVAGLDPDESYEFRAAVRHPVITLFGEDRPMTAER
jgi:alpha-L-fucosidase